jgi:CBS domain containing-hemolysin-like protein
MKFVSQQQVKSLTKKGNKHKIFWVAKISVLAFSLSLLLSLFSQVVLKQSSVILAVILLCVFLVLNVLSDMIGLAITSCQIEHLKDEHESKNLSDVLYKKCLALIRNADKVSSILCDVVGDICGILCGVSATMLTNIIISNENFNSLYVFVGALASSIVAGLTVFFKAIAKNYAVKNSVCIVKKIAKFLMISLKSF